MIIVKFLPGVCILNCPNFKYHFFTIKLYFMDSPYIGSIVLFAGNFAPRGWMLCQGQLLSIAQNTALFSILGTTYGGNGTSTFALPDLRGRVPISQGQGPGLSDYVLGETIGTENVTLLSTEMPAHIHNVMVSTGQADSATANNNYLANSVGSLAGDAVTVNTYNGTPNGLLGGGSISPSGGNLPHANMQPSLCINYIIAIVGLFPSRN
jgi:microcystin-dependent protein